jgi:hypothetical protein
MTTGLLNTCKGLIRSFGTSPSANMDVDSPKNKGLFAQCSFVIVRSATLPTEAAMQVDTRCVHAREIVLNILAGI